MKATRAGDVTCRCGHGVHQGERCPKQPCPCLHYIPVSLVVFKAEKKQEDIK